MGERENFGEYFKGKFSVVNKEIGNVNLKT